MGLINNNFGGSRRGSRAGGVLSGRPADETGKTEGDKSASGADEPKATKPPAESTASPVIERSPPKPARGQPTPARRPDPRDQNDMVKNWPIASDEPKPSRASPRPAAPVTARPVVAPTVGPSPLAEGATAVPPAPSAVGREPVSIVAEAAKAARSAPVAARPAVERPVDARAPAAPAGRATKPEAPATSVSQAQAQAQAPTVKPSPPVARVEAAIPHVEASAAAPPAPVRIPASAKPEPVAAQVEAPTAQQNLTELAASPAAAVLSRPAKPPSAVSIADQQITSPPVAAAVQPPQTSRSEVVSTETPKGLEFQPVTFGTSQAPAPLEFVLPGLAVGEVGLITEQGHAGAAALISQLVTGVALGRNLIDDRPDRRTPFHPVEAGPVAFVAGDDSAAAIQNRLYQITQALSINSGERAELEQSAVFFSARGHDLRLLSVEGESGLGFEKVLRSVARGRRLVIIEPLGRLHDADPNNAPVATNLALKLTRIAEECGCAVVVVQHDPNVIPGRSNRAGSAFEAAVRWHLLLRPAPSEELAQIGVRGKQLPKNVVVAQLDTANLPSSLPPAYLWRDPSGTLTTLPERSRSASAPVAEAAEATSEPETKGRAIRGPWARR